MNETEARARKALTALHIGGYLDDELFAHPAFDDSLPVNLIAAEFTAPPAGEDVREAARRLVAGSGMGTGLYAAINGRKLADDIVLLVTSQSAEAVRPLKAEIAVIRNTETHKRAVQMLDDLKADAAREAVRGERDRIRSKAQQLFHFNNGVPVVFLGQLVTAIDEETKDA